MLTSRAVALVLAIVGTTVILPTTARAEKPNAPATHGQMTKTNHVKGGAVYVEQSRKGSVSSTHVVRSFPNSPILHGSIRQVDHAKGGESSHHSYKAVIHDTGKAEANRSAHPVVHETMNGLGARMANARVLNPPPRSK